MESQKNKATQIENCVKGLLKSRQGKHITAEIIYSAAQDYNLDFSVIKRIIFRQ